MGCFNWFFKILGIVLMAIVVLLLPLTILAGEVGDLLFSTDNIFTMIDKELINAEFLEEVLGEALVMLQAEGEGTEEDQMRELVMIMIEDIPVETMNEAVAILFPVDLLSNLFGAIADGFYTWLNSEGYQTNISIDVQPLKTNLSDNISTVMDLIFEEMPECVEEDLAGGKWEMNCKPPEEYSDQIYPKLEEQIDIQMASIPDEIKIDEYLSGEGGQLASVRTTIMLVRDVLNLVWVLVVGVLLLGIILGARNIQGFFGWAGWPLLITSLIILLIGILLNLSTLIIINFAMGRISIDLPEFLVAPVYSIIGSILGMIGTGMIWKGLIILGAGLLSIILSLVISNVRRSSLEHPGKESEENLLSDIMPIEESPDQEDLR